MVAFQDVCVMNRGGILLLVVQEDKELESGDPKRHLITEAIAAKVPVQQCPSPRHAGSSYLGLQGRYSGVPKGDEYHG